MQAPAIRHENILLALRQHWPLWLPFLLGCGIGLYFLYPPFSPHFFPYVFVGIMVILGFISLYWRIPIGLRLCALALLLLMAGQLYAHFRIDGRSQLLPYFTKVEHIEGVITRIETKADGKHRLWIHLDKPMAQRVSSDFSQDITLRLNINDAASLAPDDHVVFTARLIPPAPPIWHSGFSFRRYAYLQGISATGHISHIEILPRKVDAKTKIWHFINQIRHKIAQHIHEVVMQGEHHPQSSAVAVALSVGERSLLTQTMIETMQASGLSHILAISGLHLGLVAALAFGAIRLLLALCYYPALHYNIKAIAALLAIPFALFYLLLAGATPPTQRAFIMTGLLLLAFAVNRHALSMRPIALAAGFILLLDPAYLISASFQLSFAAVFALMVCFEWSGKNRFLSAVRSKNLTRHDHGVAWLILRLLRYALLVMLASLVAGLATTPLVAWHFSVFSWAGLLANLIAIPLLGFIIMPLLMVSLLLMGLGLDYPFLHLSAYAIDGLIRWAEWSASLPFAGIEISPAYFPLLVLGIISWFLWVAFNHPLKRLFFPLASLSLLASLFISPNLPDMLMDGSGRLTAIRHDGGWWLNQTTKGTFVQNFWQERSGLAIKGDWQALDKQNNQNFSCFDEGYCLYKKHEKIIALLPTPPSSALHQALCQSQALIIALVYLPELFCAKSRYITKLDRKYKGYHQVFIPPNAPFYIRHAAMLETPHPWRYYKKSKNNGLISKD